MRAGEKAKPMGTCLTNTVLCDKCGHPITFIQREFKGVLKYMPVNPDGSEHWDICRGIVRTPEWCRARIAQEHREYPSGWRGKAKYVYCGDVPPWDESLGAFRQFTAAEIAAGVVCRPV
jgi:hypothetical protein